MRQIKSEYKPASIAIATLLFKPQSYRKSIPVDYVGFEIPNDFVIGWGLDYNGYGRNLEDIYAVR
jgi:hypoxanthine phosphoribosyltransferase